MTVVSVEILGKKTYTCLSLLTCIFIFHSLINYDINIDLLENSTSRKKWETKKTKQKKQKQKKLNKKQKQSIKINYQNAKQ